MSINLAAQIGFYNGEELLPSFDKFNSKENQRVMFLKLFNAQVEKEFRFSKEQIMFYKKYDIKDIFVDKIEALLNVNFTPSQPFFEFNLDKNMTNTINTFKDSMQIKQPMVSPNTNRCSTNDIDMDSIKVAFNLINMCFDGVEFTIFLDAKEMFAQFVYTKIKKKNQDKFTSRCDNCIDIVSSKNTTTKVFTYWEFLNKKDLNIKTAVDKAVDTIKTTEFNQIYLVYPKHEEFDRHIQIKSKELEACSKEYDIKVIPYSLRSTLR